MAHQILKINKLERSRWCCVVLKGNKIYLFKGFDMRILFYFFKERN